MLNRLFNKSNKRNTNLTVLDDFNNSHVFANKQEDITKDFAAEDEDVFLTPDQLAQILRNPNSNHVRELVMSKANEVPKSSIELSGNLSGIRADVEILKVPEIITEDSLLRQVDALVLRLSAIEGQTIISPPDIEIISESILNARNPDELKLAQRRIANANLRIDNSPLSTLTNVS